MNDIAIKQLKEHLSLPIDFEDNFKNLLAMADRFLIASGTDQEITPLRLLSYMDKYGDFTSGKKDKFTKMANSIFMNLEPNDITLMIPFIELCQNNYKEEDE